MLRNIFKVSILLSALAVAACSGGVQLPTLPPIGGGSASAQDPIATLESFTLADLQAASADAHANNDATAFSCYDYLLKVIPTLPNPNAGGTVGAFMIFQKGRDLANGVSASNGALKNLNLACAPLLVDTNVLITKLGVIAAGTAATGGALGPILAPIGLAKPAKP